MRPEFHFTARTGWINDPHGITVKDGVYHVFYQYVPGSTVWAPNCHWGHAKGEDLFSLAELPVALAPGEGDDGIWTGSLVVDEEGATRIFYTSTSQPDIGIGRIRVATPVDEEWIEWIKGDFVADAPGGMNLIAYRDPFVVREGGDWRMFVGAGDAEGTAMAVSYTSTHLASWAYAGVALERSTRERDPIWMGALWECPQIVEVDGRYVMVSSVWENDVLHYAGYAIGSFSDGRFHAESWGQLTFGPSYYAPSFFRDADGRPCLTFWMRGVSDALAGWASAHSVPHVLTLDGDRLVATPHPDLDKYRVGEVGVGEDAGAAVDVVWSEPARRLTVTSAGNAVLRIEANHDEIMVTHGDETWQLPASASPIRIILDAGTAEISSSGGVLGLPLSSPHGHYVVHGEAERLQVQRLAR